MLEAATAGMVSNIQKIFLMGRNVAPSNFPHFYPFHEDYRIFLRDALCVGCIRLTNNSDAGACSYAKWLDIPKDRIVKIPNFLSAYELRISRESALKARPDLKKKLIMGVFRLSNEKRPVDFLAVLKGLKDAGYEVRGVVVGDGAQRQLFASEIISSNLENFIDWYPSLNRNDLFDRYRAAICLLSCSEEEGFPNVLMEAQLNACPVLATNVGGVPEVLDHGNTGFLYPPGDLESAVRHIASMLDDDSLRSRLGSAAETFALTRFQSGNVLEKLELIYAD
jgi:glycosyltransferase involved in cell wall biosynthesis